VERIGYRLPENNTVLYSTNIRKGDMLEDVIRSAVISEQTQTVHKKDDESGGNNNNDWQALILIFNLSRLMLFCNEGPFYREG
jgi:magnesium-transporting ATPase (P-type)